MITTSKTNRNFRINKMKEKLIINLNK